MRTPDAERTFIETRLLVRYASGWKPFPFVWNEEQTEAVLQVEGDVRDIEFIGADGEPKKRPTSSQKISVLNAMR